MKNSFVKNILLATLALSIVSCARNTDDVWEDTRTAGRHVTRGVKALGGKHGSSRQVCSRDQFYCEPTYVRPRPRPIEDFIPLEDDCQEQIAMVDNYIPQPKDSPGDPGSAVPGIHAFKDPHMIPGLARIFKNISYEYNSDLVKGSQNFATLKKIAEFMRANPNTYVFIEGHCDERGPEAYNLALGARRSNTVRNMLIQEGVNPDHLFTISYGKDRPLIHEHHEEAWSQNRRAEFKIYQR
ncbi:Peptidoglycan-associated lipoprotein precursor [Candidatus Rubidus massiliensis]|nr:Peptidoglycan-associated lipoprotein precursor [Candidatus Rubidus massiliensis]